MNQKGFMLGEEVLKVVIAVICIGFLVYFLTSLYFSKIDSQKLAQAEALLKGETEGTIKNAVDNLGTINPAMRILQSPLDWNFFGFTSKKPDSCSNKNCVCICDNVLFNIGNRQINECRDKGTCLVVENLKDQFEIEINKQEIIIEEVNGKVSIKEK